MTKTLICGFDEAGRGPLAGPVTAACVILDDNFRIDELNDSKKLSPEKREKLLPLIYSSSTAWGIGWVQASEIDKINILNASLLAMERAYFSMQKGNLNGNIKAIIDGLYVPKIPIPCEAIIKADSRFPCVMAASILAKTARDRIMDYYGIFYPDYGYEKHKGYPTKSHREAIKQYGSSPIQRLSFRVS